MKQFTIGLLHIKVGLDALATVVGEIKPFYAWLRLSVRMCGMLLFSRNYS